MTTEKRENNPQGLPIKGEVAHSAGRGNYHITSLSDPAVAPYCRLTEAQLCSQQGLFIAESPKVINVALNAGAEPVSLLTTERHIKGDAAPIIERCPNIEVLTADDDLLEQITGFRLTRGVLCAMKRSLSPSKLPSELCHPSPSLLVILNNVVEATNVGAIFRSAAALGVDGVILVRSCDPLNRRALRVSMGNVFLVPWTVWEGDDLSLYAALRREGYRTAALALTDDSVTLDDPALRAEPRLALIMGTEGDGLPRESIADADYVVRIPMANGVDSLNVAAASAVAFYALKER